MALLYKGDKLISQLKIYGGDNYVKPSGTKYIIDNGVYDVSNVTSVEVQVPQKVSGVQKSYVVADMNVDLEVYIEDYKIVTLTPTGRYSNSNNLSEYTFSVYIQDNDYVDVVSYTDSLDSFLSTLKFINFFICSSLRYKISNPFSQIL